LLVRRILDFLAAEMESGDELVENLVAVSFVENVGPWDDSIREFIATWPEPLWEAARRQRDWKPA
jgi:hypothetical protein